jgi:hypothetical protein
MYLDKFKAEAEFLHDEEMNMSEFRGALSILVDIAKAANDHEKAKRKFERGCAIEVRQSIMKELDTDFYNAEMALTEALIKGKVFGLFEEQKGTEC